jgi:hypothetical protein
MHSCKGAEQMSEINSMILRVGITLRITLQQLRLFFGRREIF